MQNKSNALYIHKLSPIGKEKIDNSKHLINMLHSMQLQKEVKSDPKQPSCKISVQPHCEKRCEIQGGSQEMA